MPALKVIFTDKDGRFDFGILKDGHYTLVVADPAWGSADWFDIEVNSRAKPTDFVTIDISPAFPDCKGGHEILVRHKQPSN